MSPELFLSFWWLGVGILAAAWVAAIVAKIREEWRK